MTKLTKDDFEKQFWKESADKRNTDKQNYVTAHCLIEVEHMFRFVNAPKLTVPDKSDLMDLLWQWIEQYAIQKQKEMLEEINEYVQERGVARAVVLRKLEELNKLDK